MLREIFRISEVSNPFLSSSFHPSFSDSWEHRVWKECFRPKNRRTYYKRRMEEPPEDRIERRVSAFCLSSKKLLFAQASVVSLPLLMKTSSLSTPVLCNS